MYLRIFAYNLCILAFSILEPSILNSNLIEQQKKTVFKICKYLILSYNILPCRTFAKKNKCDIIVIVYVQKILRRIMYILQFTASSRNINHC